MRSGADLEASAILLAKQDSSGLQLRVPRIHCNIKGSINAVKTEQ